MILYVGNKLSNKGYTPTFIELLTPRLSQYYEIESVSDKQSQAVRLFDMISSLLVNKKKLKLVLIDSYSMRAFWFTFIISKICFHYKIPYIPILHGGGYPDRLKKSPDKCRFIFSNSAINISPSLYLKRHFENYNYKVQYLPNFIPVKDYNFKQRSNVKPKLLWVRSFDKTYNPLLALKILKKLRDKFPEAELCMVGPDKDGTLKMVTDEASKLGVSDSLKLTGKLSKKEWTDLSKEYDIFINTTDFDNHPISVIEAMALGMPVVSTNVGGLPFLIEDNTDGLLVPPNDEIRFTEQIERLISDPALTSKISINARRKVEGFDWEVLKKNWIEVIDKYGK